LSPFLSERLRRAARYRRLPALAKLAVHPVRESVAAAYRLLPGFPAAEASAPLFTGQPLQVLLPEIVALDLYRHGCIEPELTSILLDALRPGMAFADVGAQYGYYSLAAQAAMGGAGEVFAFEPGRRTFRLLQRNLGGVHGVRAEEVAASDSSGRRVMQDFGSRHSALNSLFTQPRTPAEERAELRPERYEVRCVTLDDYFSEVGRDPDVVKIDAESSELDVLRGMEGMLRRGSPLVTMEVGDYDVAGSPPSRECVSFLESFGYRGFEVTPGGLVPHRRRDTYEYGNLCFRKAP
jgi:FkbM family methyltransferase